jgi:nucleoside-diphosphate-sugar epimerase
VEGTRIVIEAVKATPSVKKLIYTSSFFAVGPTDGYIADENQVWLLFYCLQPVVASVLEKGYC